MAVSRLLGGVPQRDSGSWDVLTVSSAVQVEITGADSMSVDFRLADWCDLGVFRFISEAWTLAEMVGDITQLLSPTAARVGGWATARKVVLSLVPVEFETRSGQCVLFSKPVLSEVVV